MKSFLFLFILLFSFSIYGQIIITDGATEKSCGGFIYDSGGSTGAYQNNEDIRFTICPEDDNDFIQLNFTFFNTEEDSDFLSIFNGANEIDGDIIASVSGSGNPGLFVATDQTPTGCLTLIFQSDGSGVDLGFEAEVSCIQPCQTIISQIDTATPNPDPDGFIRVCPNEEITLTGSGDFENDGTGATYQFDLGDGRTINGQTATFSYPEPGAYLVNLNIRDTNTSNDPDGCKNTNILNQVIQVGTEPDFSNITIDNPEICLGNETTIRGVVNPTFFAAECTPPVSGTTSLPDGTGVEYSTCITVDCFDNNQTITSGDQLLNICIEMEHSWAGDLDISIVSPNGIEILLFPNRAVANEIYLGNANGNDDGVPGTGLTYCFSMDASVLLKDAPLVILGNPPNNGFQEGTYLPDESFDGLIGSTLNGDWCLKIRDNERFDDGTIFEWGMEFDPNLVPAELSFTPETVSEGFDDDPSIVSRDGNDIIIRPSTVGQHCYTYRTIDNHGCEYTEEVCIDVFPAVEATEPEEYRICDNLDEIDGFGEFDLGSRDSEILGGQDPSVFDVTYYASSSDAENGDNPLPDFYQNTSNPQTVYARVENTSAPTALCFVTVDLVLAVDLIPDFTLPEDIRICTDLNGSEEVEDPILDTGLSETDFSFEWFRDGEIILYENGASITATDDGLYTVEVTDNITGCSNSSSTEVVASSPPELTASVVSEPFASNNTIEAIAEGLGEYEYSLNNGDFQPEGRFNDVPAGINVITARDINGCGTATFTLTVVNFPKFFTPNNDGRNDVWNVQGLSQPDAIIYIFDRYGKLLKQLNPINAGWNGTLNGQHLPSSDYWFRIVFRDPRTGDRTTFSSHFSLIR